MIYNKRRQTYMHENTCFFIGQEIVANDKSDYAGLTGVIKEIRDGVDKDTDNPLADIDCYFDMPESDYLKAVLACRFNRPIYEIPFDEVIMAPDMIEAKAEYQINPATAVFFVLSYYEDSDGKEVDDSICVSTDLEALKAERTRQIEENESFKKDGSFSLDGFEVYDYIANDTRHCWVAESKSAYVEYTIEPVRFLAHYTARADGDE